MSHNDFVLRQPTEEDGEMYEDDCLSRAESADTRSTVSHSNGSMRYQSEINTLYDASQPPRFSYAPPPHPSMMNYMLNTYAPFDYSFLPPPPFAAPPLSSIPHQAQGICNCAQCLHTRRKYIETQAIPKKDIASGIMCCYHKRGVCKKGMDCWYSHEGNDDTPCHYGVKCVAGHAAFAKTAVKGNCSIAAVPLHAARAPPAPPLRNPLTHNHKGSKLPMRAHVLEYVEEDFEMEMAQPAPAPLTKSSAKSKQQETIPEPPTLEGETCKYCEHDGLYVMPYRLYPGNGPSLLQYRIHCNACGGSWTPSSLVDDKSNAREKGSSREQQEAY